MQGNAIFFGHLPADSAGAGSEAAIRALQSEDLEVRLIKRMGLSMTRREARQLVVQWSLSC